MAALAISPNFQQDGIVLAATAAGLYRSTDGGQQWLRVQNGLSDPRIVTVAFASTAPLAFAATAAGRLFQSQDGGANWQEVASWAGFGLINAITLSPNVSADQTLFVATNEGVFRSQDGGASWESSTFGLLDLEILCLACAPNFAESQLLWAGSAGGGLYRSRNGARSWRDAGEGLPDTAMQCLVVSANFAVDQTLYVGTESAGLYRSTDGGGSWQAVAPLLAEQSINALAISADGQMLLVGASQGVYRSIDGGHQWALTDSGDFSALALVVAPDGTALAGAYQAGSWRLAAGDTQWQAAVVGMAAHVPPSALFAPEGALYLFDVEGALVADQNADQPWCALNGELADEPVLAAALANNAQNATLYAATTTTLHHTTLTGAMGIDQWQSNALPDQCAAPTLLVAAPAFAQPPLLLADSAGSLFASADGGGHWSAVATPWSPSQLLQLAFSPDYGANQTFYALTVQPHAEHNYLLQLWQTSDDGASWLTLADFYAETPTAVLALPPDPVAGTILVGVGNRLIKLYQATSERGWAVTQHFLADTLRITSLITPADYAAGVIYITSNQGVLHSEDAGATWTPVGEGLAERTIVAFQPAMNGQPAYAVELGGVIWQG